jgi:hypothetical protein
MSEYNFFKHLIKTNNLEELINLYENGKLTREIIKKKIFIYFFILV